MTLVIAAIASQVIALLLWGHVTYLWVQGVEALVGSVALAAFAIRYRRRDPRPSRWPPLAPLAVAWFAVSSWFIWRAERA